MEIFAILMTLVTLISMHFLICPDSFKHCLSAIEAAEIIGDEIQRAGHSTELVPLADGGEGTVETLLFALGGEKRNIRVHDPLGREITAFYGLNGDTAYIEMAEPSGLHRVSDTERNPWITTTFGLGQIIKDALDQGVKKMLIGIGGSATNDIGVGMAQALGVRFLDEEGKEVSLGKETGYSASSLEHVHSIDASGLDPRLSEVEITVLCDVDNPLLEENGASAVYAPQKGANAEMVKQLEKTLTRFASIMQSAYNKDPNFPGAGAAGGLGAGLVIFLSAHLVSGIKGLIEYLQLDTKIQMADVVIVGEGQMDVQTTYGKAPIGIAKLAKEHHKQVLAIVGKVGPGYDKNLGPSQIDHIFSCYDKEDTVDLKTIQQEGADNVRRLTRLLLKDLTTLATDQYQLHLLS